MIQIVKTSHVLEIAGPRGQIWRPISDERFSDPNRMAANGETATALVLAEETYVAIHGNMKGVAFRIRTSTEILTGLGSVESVMNIPAHE